MDGEASPVPEHEAGDEARHDNGHPHRPPRIYILASEWEDLKKDVSEARQFALEARDSSRANNQTLNEVVTPKMALVDAHEGAIQRTHGALWALGVVGSLIAIGLAVLPFVVH